MTTDRELDLSRYEGATPGPWELDWNPSLLEIHTEGRLVASVRRYSMVSNEYSKETETNARLIADAPLLLAEVARLRTDLERATADRHALRADVAELVSALTESNRIIQDCRAAFGPCDHSAGICNCDMDSALAGNDASLAKHGGAS